MRGGGAGSTERMGTETTPGQGSLLFIGNATTLIRHRGFTILTDPNFLHRGQRAHLGYGITTRRRTEPALGVAELPPIDVIVLSHTHGDHWDRVAREGLDPRTPIVTTPRAADTLAGQGFATSVGLDPWETHHLYGPAGALAVTAVPARHGPWPTHRLLPRVMGSVLEFTDEFGQVTLRCLISGDTVFTRELAEIPRRFPDIDLGVVHLGGTRLLRLLTVSMTGAQGARWVELIRPRRVLPVHFDDYTAFRSPLGDFRDHVGRTAFGDRVVHLRRGESMTLPVRPVPARSPQPGRARTGRTRNRRA